MKISDAFEEIENLFIPLSDGRNLAARIWLPCAVDDQPAPAILEYLPYRKRDGTAPRDESYYPAFAAVGYAGVRVDISGTGESDGDFDDEYSPRELSDAVEVIHWIASQSWCSGSVGMMGISWGGFNSLQVAALQPEPLKAVISIGSTVDRYNDDIHYKNGCHLYSNFSWSSTMLCFASRPPDPLLVGDRWLDMWKHRLQTQPFPLENWLGHQRRDGFWRHGSVCEDYAAIRIPALVISGWGDGYINAPPAMAANRKGLAKAINGPWIHKYPHFAWPKPRMDFIGEATAWWDRWLKNLENNRESLPAYRAYISENVMPGGYRPNEPGRWVAEAHWPSDQIHRRVLYLSRGHGLATEPESQGDVSICSPQDCGTACGEFFPLKPDSELSGDHRYDDAGSLIFETEVLDDAVEILGRPAFSARLSIDQPIGNIIVRLADVHPNGACHRVTWGALNLTHRHGNTHPSHMTPGEPEEISISLNECGYRFVAGHRIRISISTAYWPMIMPPPYPATAHIELGEHTCITLPTRSGADEISIPEPENPEPLPQYVCHRPPEHRRRVERDLENNLTHYHVYNDTGEDEVDGHGMRTRHTHEECWSVAPNDPLTAAATSTYICEIARGEWRIRTVSESCLTCDADHFYISAKVTAYQNKQAVSERQWEKTIARDFI